MDPSSAGDHDMAMAALIEDATTIWELMVRRASLTPDDPAMFDATDRHVTFDGLKEWSERVAAGLAGLGVGEATPVSVQLPTRMEAVVLSLALARLSAVQNPILHLYRERELGAVLQRMTPAVYACPGVWGGVDYPAMVSAVADRLPAPPLVLAAYDRLPEGDVSALSPPPEPASADEVRWIYFTSGTTSEPKGVCHTDATLLASGVSLAKTSEWSTGDVFVIPYPITHIGGAGALVQMLSVGLPLVLLESFTASQAVEVCRRFGATATGGSTAFYQAFLAEQRKQPGEALIPTLRRLGGGGAPKPPELFFAVQREMGVPIVHGYGMTEVSTTTIGRMTDTDEQLAYSDGAPLPHVELRIVLDGERLAANGEDGEIRIRGPMVCKGYLDSEQTRAAFDADGFFKTGDLGHLRPDGHLVVTGRLKDLIIRKGENISPREVEDLLHAHPKVADVAVIGLPDPERGERVCAVVEQAPDQDPLSFDEMVAHLRAAGLMVQKIPEQLEVVDELPRNQALRKILKYKLRERYAQPPETFGPGGVCC